MNVPYEELFDSSVALKQNEWTQDALLEIPTSKGVLLFADEEDHPIQILQTGNLRRVSRSRMISQEMPSPRKTNVASLTRKICWLSCHNDFVTQVNYIRLAHVLFDKTAADWIQLPTPFMAAIDLDATLPYFYVSNDPATSERRLVYGLFPNRKTALKFTEILNTFFCLCRNPSLLKKPKKSSCPYLQMAKCPGPCLDPTQKENYLNRVHKATAGARHRVEVDLNALHRRMHDAANTMDFEKANELKKQIDLLTKLQHPDYRWVHNLKDLTMLHVDRSFREPVEGKKRKVLHYKWLKIVSDAVYDLGDFIPESCEDVQRFLERNWTTAPEISYAFNRKQHLGNIAYFLFRSKPAGFWLDCTDGIGGDRLYPGLDEYFQLKNRSDSAEKKDTEQNSVSRNT